MLSPVGFAEEGDYAGILFIIGEFILPLIIGKAVVDLPVVVRLTSCILLGWDPTVFSFLDIGKF